MCSQFFSLVRGSQYYEINFMYRWCVELFRREKFVFSQLRTDPIGALSTRGVSQQTGVRILVNQLCGQGDAPIWFFLNRQDNTVVIRRKGFLNRQTLNFVCVQFTILKQAQTGQSFLGFDQKCVEEEQRLLKYSASNRQVTEHWKDIGGAGERGGIPGEPWRAKQRERISYCAQPATFFDRGKPPAGGLDPEAAGSPGTVLSGTPPTGLTLVQKDRRVLQKDLKSFSFSSLARTLRRKVSRRRQAEQLVSFIFHHLHTLLQTAQAYQRTNTRRPLEEQSL